MAQGSPEVSELLASIAQGDRSGVPQLMTMLHDDLRRMASRFLSRESSDHTFQPTDLINECFLKLVDRRQVSWQGRTHFIAVSAQAMRRVLVDHARTKFRKKRGGRNRARIPLRDDLVAAPESPDEIMAVDEALEKLKTLDLQHAQILELRYFGGLSCREVAESLGVTARTVERHWAMICAWLRCELEKADA